MPSSIGSLIGEPASCACGPQGHLLAREPQAPRKRRATPTTGSPGWLVHRGTLEELGQLQVEDVRRRQRVYLAIEPGDGNGSKRRAVKRGVPIHRADQAGACCPSPRSRRQQGPDGEATRTSFPASYPRATGLALAVFSKWWAGTAHRLWHPGPPQGVGTRSATVEGRGPRCHA